MFKNKKAFILKEAIYLGFAAVLLIFGFLIVYYKIYPAFFGETDDGSLANFEDDLVPKIQELLKNDNKLDYTQINYFIGAAAVIGYNKVWDSQENLNIVGLRIEKPSSCGDKACLCFFKGDSLLGENPKPYKPCTKFDKVAYFLKDKDDAVAYTLGGRESTVSNHFFYNPSLSSVFTNEQYKYFLLGGSSLKSKGKVIYIEKYENPTGEVIFYLAPINDATKDKISKRKAYIDNLNNK